MIKESQWRSRRVPDKHFSQILEKHIKPTTPRVFIECGANDGINGSIGYYFENELGWQTINIEPNPFSWGDLLHNRPYSINLNVGLSDSDAILEFTMPMDGPNGHAPGRASFTRTMDFWRAEGRLAVKCEVPCTTYKQVILEQDIPGVGIFVLDVEGLEEKVLRGMQGVKPSHIPHILCIENWSADWTATTALVEKLGRYEAREQYKNNLIYVIEEQDDVYYF